MIWSNGAGQVRQIRAKKTHISERGGDPSLAWCRTWPDVADRAILLRKSPHMRRGIWEQETDSAGMDGIASLRSAPHEDRSCRSIYPRPKYSPNSGMFG